MRACGRDGTVWSNQFMHSKWNETGSEEKKRYCYCIIKWNPLQKWWGIEKHVVHFEHCRQNSIWLFRRIWKWTILKAKTIQIYEIFNCPDQLFFPNWCVLFWWKIKVHFIKIYTYTAVSCRNVKFVQWLQINFVNLWNGLVCLTIWFSLVFFSDAIRENEVPIFNGQLIFITIFYYIHYLIEKSIYFSCEHLHFNKNWSFTNSSQNHFFFFAMKLAMKIKQWKW